MFGCMMCDSLMIYKLYTIQWFHGVSRWEAHLCVAAAHAKIHSCIIQAKPLSYQKTSLAPLGLPFSSRDVLQHCARKRSCALRMARACSRRRAYKSWNTPPYIGFWTSKKTKKSQMPMLTKNERQDKMHSADAKTQVELSTSRWSFWL